VGVSASGLVLVGEAFKDLDLSVTFFDDVCSVCSCCQLAGFEVGLGGQHTVCLQAALLQLNTLELQFLFCNRLCLLTSDTGFLFRCSSNTVELSATNTQEVLFFNDLTFSLGLGNLGTLLMTATL